MIGADINKVYSFLFGDMYRIVGVMYTCWYVWLYFVRLYSRLAYLHELQTGSYPVYDPEGIDFFKKSAFIVLRTWIVMRIIGEITKKK
jgi:hypothetical protein